MRLLSILCVIAWHVATFDLAKGGPFGSLSGIPRHLYTSKRILPYDSESSSEESPLVRVEVVERTIIEADDKGVKNAITLHSESVGGSDSSSDQPTDSYALLYMRHDGGHPIAVIVEKPSYKDSTKDVDESVEQKKFRHDSGGYPRHYAVSSSEDLSDSPQRDKSEHDVEIDNESSDASSWRSGSFQHDETEHDLVIDNESSEVAPYRDSSESLRQDEPEHVSEIDDGSPDVSNNDSSISVLISD